MLKNTEIKKSFDFLNQEKITKESVEIIFEQIMSGKANTVEDAMEKSSIKTIDSSELEGLCTRIIEENSSLIDKQGEHSIGPLMGNVMKEVRGKASGEQVSNLLKKKIQEYLAKKNSK